MNCTVKHCPLESDASNVTHLAGNLAQAIRKLRRDLARCSRCAAGDECPLKTRFSHEVQAAITQVSEEWNLQAGVA